MFIGGWASNLLPKTTASNCNTTALSSTNIIRKIHLYKHRSVPREHQDILDTKQGGRRTACYFELSNQPLQEILHNLRENRLIDAVPLSSLCTECLHCTHTHCSLILLFIVNRTHQAEAQRIEVWNPSLSAAVASSICGEMRWGNEVKLSQGGLRLGTAAMHKLISMKSVEWEKINEGEGSNSSNVKSVWTIRSSCYGHCLQILCFCRG